MRGLLETLEAYVPALDAYPEWVLGLIWLAIFLIAMLLAMWAIERSKSVGQNHVANPASAGTGSVDVHREILRARRGLRPLGLVEDTTPLYKLANGIWGYSQCPADGTWPVLRQSQAGLLEVHKLEDGSVEIVGYATAAVPAEAARGELVLHPEKSSEAPYFVSIPLIRIARSSERSTDDGAVLDLEIAPLPVQSPRSKPPGQERGSQIARRAHSA